jgi:CHAT domain-containing protein
VQASIRHGASDLDAAEQLYLRAIAILEKVGASGTPSYAAGLNNLGLVYMEKRDPARAEAYFQRALALGQRLEGTESHHTSVYLQNLGLVARNRQEYLKAFDYTTRALAIRRRIVGPEHVDTAPVLNNLAILYQLAGDVSRAADTFFQALRIWEQAAGPYHRGTLTAVGNIARLYADTSDLGRAVLFQRRADAIVEKQLELNLVVGSERQKLAFVNSVAERTDRTISLHLNGAPGNADAGALAALVVLQRKGRVLDAMTDAFSAVRRVADSRGRAVLDQLNSTTARLARLALNGTADGSTGERQRAIAEVEEEKERLEVELAAYSSEVSAQMQPVTLEAVQAAVPEGAALLEFAIFRPFDWKAELPADAYGPPRYAAYVVRRNSPPQGVDLGPAAPIDRLIEGLRGAVRDRTRTDVSAHARAVHDVLIRPLRAAYGDARQLLVSPDGALNLVPFEALVDAEGRYLIERFSISYLTSGRDLLRRQVSRPHRGPPVIVADPRYGELTTGTPAAARRKPPMPSARERSVTTASEPAGLYFAPLANTAREALAIKRLFPDALLLSGPRATKAAVARLEGPRLLHIASHGFFLKDSAAPSRTGAAIENPLLRSGIALAGANLANDIRGDGILTALEASGLDLSGTKLVTLSACDTGVGEVRNGEGVYGLRRAFLLAGTEALVISLWPLSDYMAREMMVMFYAGLHRGLGRGEALRQAKLAMIKRHVRRHPYYWASFIQSGDWSGLDGRR